MLGHGCISQCGLEVTDALLDPEVRRHHYTHGERHSEGERGESKSVHVINLRLRLGNEVELTQAVEDPRLMCAERQA